MEASAGVNLAQSAYGNLAPALRLEVDAIRRYSVSDEIVQRARAVLASMPSEMRREPRPFGPECVFMVLTTVAIALGSHGIPKVLG